MKVKVELTITTLHSGCRIRTKESTYGHIQVMLFHTIKSVKDIADFIAELDCVQYVHLTGDNFPLHEFIEREQQSLNKEDSFNLANELGRGFDFLQENKMRKIEMYLKTANLGIEIDMLK